MDIHKSAYVSLHGSKSDKSVERVAKGGSIKIEMEAT